MVGSATAMAVRSSAASRVATRSETMINQNLAFLGAETACSSTSASPVTGVSGVARAGFSVSVSMMAGKGDVDAGGQGRQTP